MSIVIISPAKNLDKWTEALRDADPNIEVFTHEQVRDKSAIKFALAWNHPPGIFSHYPELKCISSMGAGVDHLLSDESIPEHIPIVRLIDPNLSQDIFEFCLAAIMNRLRSLTHYRINQTRGYWKKQPYMNMRDVSIGIMGIGVIGHFTATKLQETGFRVQGWSRTGGKQATYPTFSGEKQLPDFLSSTEILICLLPLTPQTKGTLNEQTLSLMPKGSWLINIGRGGHLNEQEFLEVLNSGHLEGANLDVFPQEPLPRDHPFWKHPRINITPHIASLTTPQSVAPQIADNYSRALKGEPLLNVVDRKTGY